MRALLKSSTLLLLAVGLIPPGTGPSLLAAEPAADLDPERAALLARFDRPAFLAPIASASSGIGPSRAAAVSAPHGECVDWGPFNILVDPGIAPERWHEVVRGLPDLPRSRQFQVNSVWSRTAINGPVTPIAQRVILTYSFVPDGTLMYTIGPGPVLDGGTAPSTLDASMTTAFGGDTVFWKDLLRESFTRWGELIGVTYFESTDDGAPMGAPGELGVRGDVRIGMISFNDGLGGVLAYNIAPLPDDFVGPVPVGAGGDMVIDSGDTGLWALDDSDYRPLRNTVMHEHGHGLGYNHVDPISQTKLMEAFLTTAFDGPQEDDIRGAQLQYGDVVEPNSTATEAWDLGTLTASELVLDDLALESPDALDWFRFDVPALSVLDIAVEPVGTTYLQGPSLGAPELINADEVLDLAVDILRGDGTTPVATLDAAAAGSAESAALPLLAGAGTYTLRVRTSSTTGDVQRYRLRASRVAGSPNAAYQLADALLSDSTGNGNANQRAEPGESLLVRLPLRNIGFAAGTGASGTLTSLSPTATITQPATTYPALAPLDVAQGAAYYGFSLSNAHVCGDPVLLRLTTNAVEGSFISDFSLPTGGPGGGVGAQLTTIEAAQNFGFGDIVGQNIEWTGTGTIEDVNIRGLDITYPNTEDLFVFVQSPQGTFITLSTATSVFGANMIDTVFDDEAAQPVATGTAPYTGSFRPESALSAVDGEVAAGTWTLGVFNQLGFTNGTLHTWTLEITAAGGTVCASPIIPGGPASNHLAIR